MSRGKGRRVKVVTQETKTVPIGKVKPHPRNPRQGDIGAIHQSINENGFYGTIVAQKSTGLILAGNHRWIAAKQAGAKSIPVTFIDVDDDHALRILLADNRTNDLASYDLGALSEVLTGLQEAGSLAGTGYDGDDLDDILRDLRPFEPNTTPTLSNDPVTGGDLDKAREKLGAQYQGERELKETMCPECGAEFMVDV